MCCMVAFFFFHSPPTTEFYTLSLHDALPISALGEARAGARAAGGRREPPRSGRQPRHRADRKSTRLNSSHLGISYAVFCLKKKKRTSKKMWPLSGASSPEMQRRMVDLPVPLV